MSDTLAHQVQQAVSAALGLDDDEVTPESTLLDELGAESIDLLDILFRIERSTGVKVQAADIAAYVQGGIPDEQFSDDDDVITATGLAHLRRAMPQVDVDAVAGQLHADQLMSLFTVGNLLTLVEQRAAQPHAA